MSFDLMNRLLALRGGRRYLEIGVNAGDTFFKVDAPLKVAVDPGFQFDPADHQRKGALYYSLPSDDFFASFSTLPEADAFRDEDGAVRWDVIFIDGLHTYEQSFRDFENSLRFAHEQTIWILDDTVPNDPYSSLPDQDLCREYRNHLGLPSLSWHGDVYKTLFAIHAAYPDISYRTVFNPTVMNPQTVLWKTDRPHRDRPFFSPQRLKWLSYFDLLQYGFALATVRYGDLPASVGQPLDLKAYRANYDWRGIVYSKDILRLTTHLHDVLQTNRTLRKELDELRESLRHRGQDRDGGA